MTWKVQVGRKSDGKPDIRSFATEGQAQAFRDDWNGKLAAGNTNGLEDLSSVQRTEVIAALAKLQAYNATLPEAVDFYLRHAKPEQGKITVETAVELFLAAKRALRRRPAYLRSLEKTFLPPFSKAFAGKMVTDVSQSAAEAYLNQHPLWSSSTKVSHINYLTTFYNFLIKKHYAKINPFQNIERPNISTTVPKILTPEDAEKMLQYALDNGKKPECAAMALVFFCGVRVEEVERLNWKNVTLTGDTPEVEISDRDSKTGHRRVNPISPNAVEWLNLCQTTGKIAPNDYLQRMKRLRGKCGVAYPQNAMRHCFASYHISRFANAATTAHILGHPDSKLLYKTYYSLAAKSDAIRFWNILPTSVVIERDKQEREDAEAQSEVGQAVKHEGCWYPVRKEDDHPPPPVVWNF